MHVFFLAKNKTLVQMLDLAQSQNGIPGETPNMSALIHHIHDSIVGFSTRRPFFPCSLLSASHVNTWPRFNRFRLNINVSANGPQLPDTLTGSHANSGAFAHVCIQNSRETCHPDKNNATKTNLLCLQTNEPLLNSWIGTPVIRTRQATRRVTQIVQKRAALRPI